MVAAVRRGATQREVARRFGVSLRTVQHWVKRAAAQRLDRVDWTDHRRQPRVAVNRTPAPVEQQVVQTRRALHQSVLGEVGAAAIHTSLQASGCRPPSVRTIGRILVRQGVIDGRDRRRQPPPPPGWHLPTVAARELELDLFDCIETLKLAQGPRFDVLTSVGLHSGLPAAWPLPNATTSRILTCLTGHWRQQGRPGFAQFDNDTRFQGAHQYPDVFGRVVRLCLQLEITPVFVPPRELGFQNPVESFNALWQTKVWHRFHFDRFPAVTTASAAYTRARRRRLAERAARAPHRAPWPRTWVWDPTRLRAGRVIYIRRTSEHGTISLLGRSWKVDRHWCHRLVRAEVDLAQQHIRCFALRRRDPADQPVLAELPYAYPRGDLLA